MKHSLTTILVLLLCCVLLCACGQTRQTETVHLPAAEITPAPTPTPAPATPQPLSESEQRALIERCRAVWARPDYELEVWFYAIADMDHNGRLEVLTASLQGTGLYTWAACWEVNADYTGLAQCPDDTLEGQAWPDIITDSIGGWHDAATGRYTYLCNDLMRDGATRYYISPNTFCLHDGRIDVRVLATMEEIYDQSGSSVKNYYDASGSPITEEEYNTMAERSFAGQERVTLRLDWTQVEPQAATPAPAGQYLTAETPAPEPSQTPQPGAPVITKNPTGETVSVGGNAWFIAHADNAYSLVWQLVAPNGDVYSLGELMARYAGLELEALEGDTLAVRGIPIDLDGWSVQARFDGSGGTALSASAVIHVEDYVSIYGSVISQYFRAYTAGSLDAGYAYENGISEFIAYSDHVGYLIKDLDKDGVPELVIAGMGTEDFSEGVVYDLYTLENGQPVQIACSSARNRYYLRADNRVYNEGSGGAGHSVFIICRLAGAALNPEESVFTFFDNGPSDGYYHQTDGCTYQPRPGDTPISETEFNALVDAYQAAVIIPQLTMIA